MKRQLFVSYVLLIFGLAGCALFTKPKARLDNMMHRDAFFYYSGPKARVAVADFDVKAAKATGDIGLGLREMLLTALVNSERFSVLERHLLNAVIEEQELSSSESTQTDGSESQENKIKTADLIIAATLTEFEPQSSGGKEGLGGGGGVGSGDWGGLLGVALNKAHLALDIRIVDTSTSEILAATRVQGQASDVAGSLMGSFFGDQNLSGGLSAYANTSMEKAIRVCIIEAVRYISEVIPAGYYKY